MDPDVMSLFYLRCKRILSFDFAFLPASLMLTQRMLRAEKLKIAPLLELVGALIISFYVIRTKPSSYFSQREVTIRCVLILFVVFAQLLLPKNAVSDLGVILKDRR